MSLLKGFFFKKGQQQQITAEVDLTLHKLIKSLYLIISYKHISQSYIFLLEKSYSKGLETILFSTPQPCCCCCCSHVRAGRKECAPVISVLLESLTLNLVPTKMTTEGISIEQRRKSSTNLLHINVCVFILQKCLDFVLLFLLHI